MCMYVYKGVGSDVEMAGQVCPKCNQQTFFTTSYGRKCSKCGYTMTLPPNNGKGGRGGKCNNCKKFTVFNCVCKSCGAKYSFS